MSERRKVDTRQGRNVMGLAHKLFAFHCGLCICWGSCYGARRFQPDAFGGPAELIRSKGYVAEEHQVVTQDGYVLSLQRIPHGRSSATSLKSRPPVLLVHGLFSSAVEWVINHPNQSLGFLLADCGYDVWLGNFRGTPYANRHVEYENTDGRYWNFSLDEVGLYDFPALVDLVLAATGKSSLFFVGFSQGNTAAWVMLADRPAYNHKIRLLMALAPVANMSFIRSPIRFLVPVSPVLTGAAIAFNRGRFLVRSETTKRLFYNLCETPLRYLCSLPTFFLFGVNLNQLNEIIRARNFMKYDHGTGGNIARYGQPTSPAYDLARITAPVALFSSVDDYFANPRDVGTLRKSLPNVVFDYVVPEPGFVHLDFVLGTGAAQAVYEPLIGLMGQWAVGMQ